MLPTLYSLCSPFPLVFKVQSAWLTILWCNLQLFFKYFLEYHSVPEWFIHFQRSLRKANDKQMTIFLAILDKEIKIKAD